LLACESSPIDATGEFSASNCFTVLAGGASAGDFTGSSGALLIQCSCHEPQGGLLAVVGHRVTPDTSVDPALGVSADDTLWGGVPVGAPAAFAAVYLVVALLAARADARGVLYASAPPEWLTPGAAGWTPCFQLLLTFRLFHSCFRW